MAYIGHNSVAWPTVVANTSNYSMGELTVGGTILLDNTGRIGIGTTSPASLLHIDQGSGGDGLRFERDSYDTMDIELSESGFRIRNETDGRTDFFIDGGGDATFAGDVKLGTDKEIQFRDSALKIYSSADGQLDIAADTEIELTSTTVAVEGILNVSGTSWLYNDVYHPHDGVVIHYGADHEITLTHVPDSGLRLADNDKMLFGTDSDSEIYHNGSNFYISNDTGNALLYSDTFQFFSHTGSELFAQFNHNAAVNLYYDSAKKFETTSTGISVTGGVSALTNPGVGNDQMYMGFSAPNGMLYSKNSSGAPASNLFMGTTDGSGNTNNVLSLHYDGKVGIGTTSPAAVLDIVGNSDSVPAFKIGANATHGWEFYELATGGHLRLNRVVSGTSTAVLQIARDSGNITMSPASGSLLFNDSSKGIYYDGNELVMYTTGADDFVTLNGETFVRFNTNSVEAMRILLNRNVGIGTTSPSNLLHVYGASEAALTLGAANTRSGLFLHKPGTTTVMGSALLLASDETFRLGTASHYHMQMYQNGSINFYASGSIAATLATTGRLGIGTTSPDSKLHIVSPDNSATTYPLIIQNAADSLSTGYGSYGISQPAGSEYTISVNDDLVIDTNSTERMRILEGGNVGIGTTSPSSKIEVQLTPDATTTSSLMNANNINDMITLSAPYGSSPGSSANAEAKWGIQFQGAVNQDTQGKSASIYAVSRDTGAGYNREVGLAFYTSSFDSNQAQRMIINEDGLVGVGTTSPTAALHVFNEGSNYTDGAYLLVQSTNASMGGGATFVGFKHAAAIGGAWKPLKIQAATSTTIMQLGSSGQLGVGESSIPHTNRSPLYHFVHDDNTGMDWITADTLAFKTGGTERLRIENDGNIKATSGTQFKGFHLVKTDGGTVAQLVGHGSDNDEGGLNLWDGGTKKVQILANGTSYLSGGNIGIGTTSPGAELEIAGDYQPLIVNSTSSSGAKIILEDNGTARGYLGATSTQPVTFYNSSATLIGCFDSNGNFEVKPTQSTQTISVEATGGGAKIEMQVDGGTLATVGSTNNVPTAIQANSSEAVRVLTNGKVGIATSAPSTSLHVKNGFMRVQAGNQQSSDFTQAVGIDWSQESDSQVGKIQMVRTAWGNAPHRMEFYVRNASSTILNALTIDYNGNVGIGTNAPATALHINKSLPYIRLQDSDGTNQYGQVYQASGILYHLSRDNTSYGQYMWYGYNGTNHTMRMLLSTSGHLHIAASSLGTIGSTVGCALYANGTLGSSASANRSVFARMTSDGDVIEFRRDTTDVGSISVSSSATAYNTSSDYRLKENVTYDWDATSRLMQLKPARFNWIVDETDTLEDGFLAHEVSDVVHNAVMGEKDGEEMQVMDHSKLVPLLVKTIQELEARIKALES